MWAFSLEKLRVFLCAIFIVFFDVFWAEIYSGVVAFGFIFHAGGGVLDGGEVFWRRRGR